MPSMKLKKLWRRKSVDITECDPTYKVTYLGNVLTGWAKGEGCVEKPLATLWRNYCQSSRPDISMKVTICGAGLRAVTREHGLTEYWAHRVTYCAAHPAYPRVFCWVYRHEGRRLKQELRCHAVLCPKVGKAEAMATLLKDRLALALHEFRREKTLRQNARLSVVNALYDTGPVPTRKLYLVTGASNYRPPLERSKSAPKLGAIEEMLEEEEEEEEGSVVDLPELNEMGRSQQEVGWSNEEVRRSRLESGRNELEVGWSNEELRPRRIESGRSELEVGWSNDEVRRSHENIGRSQIANGWPVSDEEEESPIERLLSRLRPITPPSVSRRRSPASEYVALVYEQVRDSPTLGTRLHPNEGRVTATFSTPDLVYKQSHSTDSTPPDTPSPPDCSPRLNIRNTSRRFSSPIVEETLPSSPRISTQNSHMLNTPPRLNVSSRLGNSLPDSPPDSGGSTTPPLSDLPPLDGAVTLLESFKEKLGLSASEGLTTAEESLTSDQPESIGSHSCSSSCGDTEEVLIIEGKGTPTVCGVKKLDEEDNISEESGYAEDKENVGILLRV